MVFAHFDGQNMLPAAADHYGATRFCWFSLAFVAAGLLLNGFRLLSNLIPRLTGVAPGGAIGSRGWV